VSASNFLSARRLRRGIEQLKRYGFGPETLGALSRFLTQAADRELYQANPRYWAERLSLDERTMLTLIVAGVAEGLFDLDWQTVCPICKYYGRTASSLGGVTQLHYCEKCDHNFDAYLDEEIVVAVSVNETLRRLSPTRRLDPVFRELVNARFGRVPALALINIPAFRELVAQQNLPEGQWLGVKRLAIFFSDLRGSTALYHKVGDAQAYRWVCDHFKVLFDAAARHNGNAVKTIGDGVMGVFADPRDALRSLADALAGLAELNARIGLADQDRLTLKIGLHAGPCIVVTLNGRLDYFGETVNIAARLGELATGDDVVLSHAILDDPQTCVLAEGLGEVLPLTARLRGLPESFELHRLVPRSAVMSASKPLNGGPP
jgi:class 3 adenylate cyclase